MVLESDARQREAEEKAIDEIAGTSESSADKGKRGLADYLRFYTQTATNRCFPLENIKFY